LGKKNLEKPVMSRPVLIIGAGIGGLTLGRTLSKLGIPVKIFDCRSSVAPAFDRGLGLWENSQVKPLESLPNIVAKICHLFLFCSDLLEKYRSWTIS
jgi:cation diffusion facilitator CzcD-associated flavoprotein CzcO